MRNRWLLAALTVVALAFSACSEPADPEAAARAAEAAVQEALSYKEIRREPARPYGDATKVELVIRTFEDQPSGEVETRFSEGRVLTPEERNAIEGTISLVTWSHSPPSAACCVPHHFLRYYDNAGRQIGEVAICFCCTCISSAPRLPGVQGNTELEFDPKALKAVLGRMGVRTDYGCEEEPIAASTPSSG